MDGSQDTHGGHDAWQPGSGSNTPAGIDEQQGPNMGMCPGQHPAPAHQYPAVAEEAGLSDEDLDVQLEVDMGPVELAMRLHGIKPLYTDGGVTVALAWLGSRRVVVKSVDTSPPEELAKLLMEKRVLSAHGIMAHLRGKCVPVVLWEGYTLDQQTYQIVIDYIEGAHPCKDSPRSTLQAAEKALKRVHKASVTHGDLRSENIVIRKVDGKVFFVNWCRATVHPSPNQVADDLARLRDAFGESYPAIKDTGTSRKSGIELQAQTGLYLVESYRDRLAMCTGSRHTKE